MTTTHVPDPLRSTLLRFFNVNALTPDSAADARDVLEDDLQTLALFKQQLASAIANRSVTPQQYEALTSSGVGTHDEVVEELSEIWTEMFPDEPLPRTR